MRTLSTTTRCGLRAFYYLSRHYGERFVLVQNITDEEHIPKKFLELTLLIAKRGGLIKSKPGRGGGYRLVREPGEITIGQIIRTLEGPLAPLPCASETAFKRCAECVDEKTCGTRLVMLQVRNATAAILDGLTLAEVSRLTSFDGLVDD